MTPREQIMNRRELMEYLGISVTTVDRMLRRAEVPHFRIGDPACGTRRRGVRFRKSDIDRWIENQIKEQYK